MDVPLEEAAEAEALAMLLTEVPLGDPLEVLSATWTVKDAELLQAALTLDGRVLGAGPGQASADEEGSPPPRALLAIFDRPLPEKDDDLYPETVSRLVGKAMLFGRQTDREARLEVNDVTREDLRQIRDLLAEVAGDAIDAEPAEEEVTGRVSASQRLLQRNWRLPGNKPAGPFDALVAAHMRDALLNSWPELELGVLDGKSARQVAGEQSYRLKLLAAVLVLQSWAELTPGEFDFNLLRAELGLPVLEPIDPREVDIERLPLVRLSRVMTEKASDEALRVGYRRAMVFSAAEALEKFARAIVDRDSLAGDEVQIQSYRTLAELERDSEKALEHLERGRSAAESAGMSSAFWDVMELTMRFARREGDRVGWLMEHIQREHIEEPDVAEVLAQFLVSVGVIRPDGTPAGKGARQDRPAAAEPGTGDKVGLWTPGNEGAGGGKKIWLPG
jgi:hypothetical protein